MATCEICGRVVPDYGDRHPICGLCDPPEDAEDERNDSPEANPVLSFNTCLPEEAREALRVYIERQEREKENLRYENYGLIEDKERLRQDVEDLRAENERLLERNRELVAGLRGRRESSESAERYAFVAGYQACSELPGHVGQDFVRASDEFDKWRASRD